MPCEHCGQVHAEGVTACTTPTPPPVVNPPPPGLSLSAEQQQALLAAPGVLQALITRQSAPATPAVPDGSLVFSPEQVTALVNSGALGTLFGLPAVPPPAPEQRQPVNPTRPIAQTSVREEGPYRFDAKGNLTRGRHDFSTDLIAGLRDGDKEALGRAEQFVRTQFDTDMADVPALNPSRQRPDLYVDQKEFTAPIWNAIAKGSIPDATPFVLPKFGSSSGLVGAHTEAVEPTAGVFTATAQTITPSAVSGKVSITREAWDQGGNPQLSGLIWRQMLRAWDEALEASAVTLLNGLTVTDIPLTAGGGTSGQTADAEIRAAFARLQFVRGGFRMRDFFLQVDLYSLLTGAKDNDGRPLYPVLGPTNTSGTVADFFADINVAGLRGRPAWALAASGAVPAKSYLFDRNDVSGWATAPNRLTFENVEVRYVHVGIWGYKALACTDTTGVRTVTYDPVP